MNISLEGEHNSAHLMTMLLKYYCALSEEGPDDLLFYIGIAVNSLQPTEDSSKRKAGEVKGEDIACKLKFAEITKGLTYMSTLTGLMD